MAEKYWYQIKSTTDTSHTYEYSGSSPYNEEELVRRIEAGRMILLNDFLRYEPEGGKWMPRLPADVNANQMGRVYLRAEKIVAVCPLKRNPLDDSPEGSSQSKA
jgi:hypothetical protein